MLLTTAIRVLNPGYRRIYDFVSVSLFLIQHALSEDQHSSVIPTFLILLAPAELPNSPEVNILQLDPVPSIEHRIGYYKIAVFNL